VADLADVGTGVNANQVGKMEILSCHFEVAPEGTAQFVRFSGAFTSVIDNCWFQGGSTLPDRGAAFVNNSQFCRFSNNSVENTGVDIVLFDSTCFQSVEFCNRDMSSDLANGYPRITIEGTRVIGMSRGALGVTRHHDDVTRPDAASDPQPGSLVWLDDPGDDSPLQVWDGSTWRSVNIT
jgi:hypothetical protein